MTHLEATHRVPPRPTSRLKLAIEYQHKAREAAARALNETALMLPGGDPVSAIYWQREAKYFHDRAAQHLGAAMEVGERIEEVEEAIAEESCRNQPRLQFVYTNWKGHTSIRTTLGGHIFFGATEYHKEQQWLFRAFDCDKKDFRDFALTDMRFIEHPSVAAFQLRVQTWLHHCFGDEIALSITERNHRFGEEALELIQANGCTKEEVLELVDYVYSRPAGDPPQEVGGVMVTLAALCTRIAISMQDAAMNELRRVEDPNMVAKIRAKHAAKPKFSPLPGSVQPVAPE